MAFSRGPWVDDAPIGPARSTGLTGATDGRRWG